MPSHFKKALTSRYGSDGLIIEVDWSQLEIICQQIESQDGVLGAELNDGVDLHTMMTADIYPDASYKYIQEEVRKHNPVWVERRRQTKRARFALQYGAGAKRIRQLTGWSLTDSINFIDTYNNKYNKIVMWQLMVRREVEQSAKPCNADGQLKGQYTSPTGRRVVFKTGENGRFSPTQLKNYPIQGLASDFVAHMTGKLMRDILYYEMLPVIHLTNTIHDSIVLDVHKDAEEIALDIIETCFSQAQQGMRELVQGKRLVEVPFKYSITSGHSWAK
jgi:DNA polymerase I-like protein with 3'-5' exonuclease and polymerase domains